MSKKAINMFKHCIIDKCNNFREGYNKTCRICRVLKNKYNITNPERNKMIEDQNNKCKICLIKMNRKGNNHPKTAVVDHCHKTGRIRGILCNNCNRGIGLLKEKKTNLLRAIDHITNEDK